MYECALCDAPPVATQDRAGRFVVACSRPCPDHKPRAATRLAAARLLWDADQRVLAVTAVLNETRKRADAVAAKDSPV